MNLRSDDSRCEQFSSLLCSFERRKHAGKIALESENSVLSSRLRVLYIKRGITAQTRTHTN